MLAQSEKPRLPNMSTFNSQESNASSAVRFDLDDHDTHDILVYTVRGGYRITSQRDLCKDLDKGLRCPVAIAISVTQSLTATNADQRSLRCSRKPIGRGASRVEVQVRDLFNEPERSQHADYPNQRSSIASVGLPTGVYWRRLFFNHFKDLYIVSPNGTPTTSAGTSNRDSPEEGTSPSNTWSMSVQC